MFSQQKQNLDEYHQQQLFVHDEKKNQPKYTQSSNRLIQKYKTCQQQHCQKQRQSLSINKNKFDIKKFQNNVLKHILKKSKHIKIHKEQTSNHKNSSTLNLNLRQSSSKKYIQNYNKFKQIKHKRKQSIHRSKSRKQLQLKKISQQMMILQKSHLNNTKILRQKLISSLKKFNDYQLINIQSSIPILKQANILKILTTLQQTKQKIQDKKLQQGRIKQQAKFIYFLWKMINQEQITTKHLKQIILILNQLNKNDLVDTLYDLYNRDKEIIRMLVDCWVKLKMDKFYYNQFERGSGNKNNQKSSNSLSKNVNLNSKLNNFSTQSNHKSNEFTIQSLSNNKLQKTIKIHPNQKTLKKQQRCKTQTYDDQKLFETEPNQQSFKNIKFLHPQQEKKLIQRLYEVKKDQLNKRQRIKTQYNEQKQNIQIQKCTFKPKLLASSSSKRSLSKNNLVLKQRNLLNQSKERQNYYTQNNSLQKSNSSIVKGFQKAVKRMKVGHSQTKLKQQMLNYLPKGQNYQKVKKQPANPPKFLQRQKQNKKKQQLILFVIQFQIGRHKVKVKIHPTDTQMSVSRKIAKIYGLKSDQQEEIRQIVSMELNNYYKNVGESVSEFIDN